MSKNDLQELLKTIECFIREEERHYISSLKDHQEFFLLKEIKQTIRSLRSSANYIQDKIDTSDE